MCFLIFRVKKEQKSTKKEQDKKHVFLYPALFASILCSYAEISARNAAVLSSLCTYPIRNIKLFSEHYFSPRSVRLCLLIFFQRILLSPSVNLNLIYRRLLLLNPFAAFSSSSFFDNDCFRINKILQFRKKE